ncbi:MAG: acyl CoA thioester hydrolase family protein [Chitinophagaceae bacterium]|nr:acyl CoA thioester hydrolase family protein [Chitinophagaceae bacterium]
MSFKTVSASKTTITELMIPSYANFGGKIHGGILLSLMDKAAFACASKHAGSYCVTVSVDTVDFMQPIEVGELVSLHASVHHVGKSSMLIGINVVSENVTESTVRNTNTSFFTMVAKDNADKPKEVPGLILETEDEVKRFIEGIERKLMKDAYKKGIKALREKVVPMQNLDKLESERCQINLKK